MYVKDKAKNDDNLIVAAVVMEHQKTVKTFFVTTHSRKIGGSYLLHARGIDIKA